MATCNGDQLEESETGKKQNDVIGEIPEMKWKSPHSKDSADSGYVCNWSQDYGESYVGVDGHLDTNGKYSDNEELAEGEDDVFMHSEHDLNLDSDAADMLASGNVNTGSDNLPLGGIDASACQPSNDAAAPVCAITNRDYLNENATLDSIFTANAACRAFDYLDESTEADAMHLGEIRSLSECSEGSWNSAFSTESHQDELAVQCKEYMAIFVRLIFSDSGLITQMEKAKFGRLCQHSAGRLWFARHVNAERVNSQKVCEQTFYRLVQFFAVCLFECDHADDFVPAKSLMNMCFTFYHEHEGFPRNESKTTRGYLYSFLKDQPIWQSLRFWNAAFFDAVHCEREQRSPVHRENWRHMSSEEREDTLQQDENITFGQLVTFTNNMMAFGLDKQLCLTFFEKQSVIGGLSEDQNKLIVDNIEEMSQPQNKIVATSSPSRGILSSLNIMRRSKRHSKCHNT